MNEWSFHTDVHLWPSPVATCILTLAVLEFCRTSGSGGHKADKQKHNCNLNRTIAISQTDPNFDFLSKIFSHDLKCTTVSRTRMDRSQPPCYLRSVAPCLCPPAPPAARRWPGRTLRCTVGLSAGILSEPNFPPGRFRSPSAARYAPQGRAWLRKPPDLWPYLADERQE